MMDGYRINGMMSGSSTCQVMKVGYLTVYRLEMGDILFFDAESVEQHDACRILQQTVELIFRLGLADLHHEVSGRTAQTVPQQGVSTVYTLGPYP